MRLSSIPKRRLPASRGRWLSFSVLGFILVGLGLSLLGEAILKKGTAEDWKTWFWWGTGALIVVNSGLSFIGQAIIEKIRLLQRIKNQGDH